MQAQFINQIAAETGLTLPQVQATLNLLNDSATVPFIARYRKEATSGLDEVAITQIRDLAVRIEELDRRRAVILKSLDQNGHLDDALEARVMAAENVSVLEDIYLPFRPKRRTRAMAAREKGLEPLADAIFKQVGSDPQRSAADFIDPQKEIDSIETALSGARDIIAERINEDQRARAALRRLFSKRAELISRVANNKESEAAKYRDYFDWREPAARAPSHRILAIRRGEKEDLLNMSILPPENEAVAVLRDLFVSGEGPDSQQVEQSVTEAYKRLLSRAMETEMRVATKERADTEAIRVFAENLRQLLLAPPLGAKRVMGVDPGFRTGCKLACLDRQGQLVHHDTIHPHTSERLIRQAADVTKNLCRRFEIEAIAIGNGTAGRETESFFRGIQLPGNPSIVIVNESGASIYSASEIARQEFPDLDLTVRGAVSIGRRLMDPLAELVKIDPKSIGVGQYQHDVDQKALKQSLDDVVVSCVNHVGVDLNRASAQLLTYVSGLGSQLAKNIVAFRNDHGPFRSREDLKQVSRLGPKAFEQAAGFLKVLDGDNPLDASAVHPESYAIVNAMAADVGCQLSELLQEPELRKKIDIHRYAGDRIGIPTLTDIMSELNKPGRDPRNAFRPFAFAENVKAISDLVPGMKLPGIVTNVTAFGAFVDLGVHQDGLVHISQLADRFVSNPHNVVKVNQEVEVTVIAVDTDRQRIGLSMKDNADRQKGKPVKNRPLKEKTAAKAKNSAKRTAKPKIGRHRHNGSQRPFHNPFADALKDKES